MERSSVRQILTLPFVLIWKLLSLVVGLVGRLIALVLGIVLTIVGILLTTTVVGAIIGIPLIFIGFGLILRALR